MGRFVVELTYRKNGEIVMKKKQIGLAAAIVAAAGLTVFASASAVASAAAPQGQQAGQNISRRNLPPDFMGVAGIAGWVVSGTPRTFARDGLYGYVDGGAEIFLQYGFQSLTVYELVPEKPAAKVKGMTLEIYRMASPAAAFGIFSTRREGNETVLPGIKTAHWIGEQQTNLVKGDLYINILSSGCTQDEVETFVFSLDRALPAAETSRPEAFSCMPEFSLIPGTERYICGDVAAASESPLLGADFWGFKEGITEAYSAKYGPGPSKLILIHFKQPPGNLLNKVLALFNEYLLDVTTMDEIMQGQTVIGRKFYFGWNGPNGILVLDEPDPKVARARIQEALDKAAKRLEEKPKKKSEEKK
jgi:hypothetical protein